MSEPRRVVGVRYTPPGEGNRGPPFDLVQVVEGRFEVNELPGLGSYWREDVAQAAADAINERLGVSKDEAKRIVEAGLAKGK